MGEFSPIFSLKMEILKYKRIGETISKSQIEKKLETYLKTSRIGFEIEGNVFGLDSRNISCDGCENGNYNCMDCDVPDDWEECPHFRSSDCYCRYYGESICNLCARRDDESVSGNPLMDIFNEISKELGNIPTYKDDFKENKEFLYIYNDGSVNTELVTGALKLSQIKKVFQKALTLLKKYGVKVSPMVNAGGHQTISHQDYFSSAVARNTIQINRYYLPSLLSLGCVKGSEKRNNDFRSCPLSPIYGEGERRVPIYNKSSSINFKETSLAVQTNYKLIEFRYPDSHRNINQVILSAVINMSTVAKAFSLSSEGVAVFSQNHFDEVKSEVAEFYSYGHFKNPESVKDETHRLVEYLEDEISSYANVSSVYSAVDEIMSHNMLMENGMDVGEIRLK